MKEFSAERELADENKEMIQKEERDLFLTELLGFKVHHDPVDYDRNEPRRLAPIDFSTWENFGRLFEFAEKQTWWIDFVLFCTDCDSFYCSIKPNERADAIYKFLKRRVQ
jgi:hypothetical protein